MRVSKDVVQDSFIASSIRIQMSPTPQNRRFLDDWRLSSFLLRFICLVELDRCGLKKTFIYNRWISPFSIVYREFLCSDIYCAMAGNEHIVSIEVIVTLYFTRKHDLRLLICVLGLLHYRFSNWTYCLLLWSSTYI